MNSRNPRLLKPLISAVLSDEDSEEEQVETYSDLDDPLVEDFEETTHNTENSFTPAQLATIESTVQSSVDHALQSFSISANLPFMGATPSYGGTQPRRPGTATPLGLHRPLERSLKDKILQSEFIDFTLLLLDSLTQPQVPELQLRLDDLSPGSLSSPLSKVRKRKPVIDTFHTWLDAYTTYMLVIVAAYPRRSIELLKYQQIISREETQFQGLAWVWYDEQSSQGRKRPSLSWDQVDLDLWKVLFSGLAKPHCLTCCSPYYKQSECPSADHSRRQPKGPVCFKFNR